MKWYSAFLLYSMSSIASSTLEFPHPLTSLPLITATPEVASLPVSRDFGSCASHSSIFPAFGFCVGESRMVWLLLPCAFGVTSSSVSVFRGGKGGSNCVCASLNNKLQFLLLWWSFFFWHRLSFAYFNTYIPVSNEFWSWDANIFWAPEVGDPGFPLDCISPPLREPSEMYVMNRRVWLGFSCLFPTSHEGVQSI